MVSSSLYRRRRAFALFLLLAALVAGLLVKRHAVSRTGAVKHEVRTRANCSDAVGTVHPAMLTPAAVDAAATTAGTTSMRALTFAIAEDGIRIAEALVVSGRAKAPPRSVAANRLEFEALDDRGDVVYAGSVDHPLHRTFEYEDPQLPGTLRQVEHKEPRGAFQIRIPENIPAVRIVFTDVQTRGGREVRTPSADLPLR